MFSALLAKLKEALISVLPVALIVVILHFTPLVNLTNAELITFIVSAIALVVGIGLFSLGADLAMMPMGDHIGAGLSGLKKVNLLLVVCFLMGVLITVAEPDLSVLATQVKDKINPTVLTISVGVGVGLFLLLAVLKILLKLQLSMMLFFFYSCMFAFASLVVITGNGDFLALAFDSGGVASGPLTSSFILPLAIGVCSALHGESSVLSNAFGVVAMVAMTPLITIQLLGFKAVITKRVRANIAMRKFLAADDDQIIYF